MLYISTTKQFKPQSWVWHRCLRGTHECISILYVSSTCDPYLPDIDTPHGGEKERKEEDAVIVDQEHPWMTATLT